MSPVQQYIPFNDLIKFDWSNLLYSAICLNSKPITHQQEAHQKSPEYVIDRRDKNNRFPAFSDSRSQAID